MRPRLYFLWHLRWPILLSLALPLSLPLLLRLYVGEPRWHRQWLVLHVDDYHLLLLWWWGRWLVLSVYDYHLLRWRGRWLWSC